MCTLSIKPVPYPGPGKAFSAVADVSRGTRLGDNRADRGSALERPGPRGGKAASCKEAPCLGDESANCSGSLSTEVLSVARALLLSRFSSERSEHPLVWGDGFLPSTALKYKGRWGVGAAHRREALRSLLASMKADEEHVGAPVHVHQGLLTCFACPRALSL